MSDRQKYHRRSIRLKDYDYSTPGGYFVTICTQNDEILLSSIKNNCVILNEIGLMINKWWIELPVKFPNLTIDEYIIMPDHLHGIIIINDTVGADPRVRPHNTGADHSKSRGKHAGLPLPRAMQWFKTMTTNEYLKRVNNQNWPPVSKRFWQRNYYEHIIRNYEQYLEIKKYILDNPVNWGSDKYPPTNIFVN